MAKYKIIPSSRTIVRSPISIGHKAEKGVEAIEFDLTAWVETYGSGTLTVIMRRWGDAAPYPIALEIDENNKATWTFSDIDTAKAGMAYAQLNYIVGDEVVKKSDIYTFRVMDSLTGEGEPPEAYESWLEHLTHLAAEAMAEVLDIEGIVTDKTLTVDGGVADAKKTGDEISQIKADLEDLDERVDALESGGGSGLTESIKTALMNVVNHIAWDDDDPTGQTYITALYNALYPPVDIVSISAVYTQSGVVYDTDLLNSLKSDLVVTAHMSDQTSQSIVGYSLSGTLAVGTSTITVSYSGKSTTFTVSVTKEWDAEWSYTDGVLPEVKGFSVLMPEDGNPSISLGNDGLNLSLVYSTTGVGYRYDQYDEIGVFEVVFSLTSSRTALYISQTEDGESGISIRGQYSSNYKGIYLCDSETIANMTKICDAAQNTDYKVTLVHNNGTAKVYVDDVLMLDNISIANIYFGTYTQAVLKNSGNSGTATAKIKSMKVRIGRIE